MVISDIQQSVTSLWQFLVSPVSILLGMIAITYFIWGQSFVKQLQGLVLRLRYIENQKVEKSLTLYGIDKLMPLIVLFIIVFILYTILMISNGIGYILPPYLSYQQDNLFLKIGNDEQLARIWAAYPNIKDFSRLTLLIQQTTEFEENESLRRLLGIDYWKDEILSEIEKFDSIKFLIFWAVLSLLFSRKLGKVESYPVIRFLIILFILVIIGVYFIVGFLYSVEQLAFSELIGIEMKVGITTGNAKEDLNSTEHFKQEVEYMQKSLANANMSWWHIQLRNDYFYKWAEANP